MIMIGQVERCGYNDVAPLVYHRGNFELTPGVGSAA